MSIEIIDETPNPDCEVFRKAEQLKIIKGILGPLFAMSKNSGTIISTFKTNFQGHVQPPTK